MRRILTCALMIPLAACEPTEQSLPFAPEDAEPVTRTIPADGGWISSPAGASLYFPPGSLSGEAIVTLDPLDGPGGLQASGTIASGAFGVSLQPPGLLVGSARAELRLDPAAAGDSAWLATLARVGGDSGVELVETRVDLTTSIASGPVTSPGVLALVIPAAAELFPVRDAVGSTPAPQPVTEELALRYLDVDSLSIVCGAGAGRCPGLRISASSNLLDRIARGAVVDPRIRAVLRLQDGLLSGTLMVEAPLRAELSSRSTAESVVVDESHEVNARLFPAGTTATPTFPDAPLPPAEDAVIDVGGGALIHLPGDGSDPTLIFTEDIQLPDGAGGSEPASVRIVAPLELHR